MIIDFNRVQIYFYEDQAEIWYRGKLEGTVKIKPGEFSAYAMQKIAMELQKIEMRPMTVVPEKSRPGETVG